MEFEIREFAIDFCGQFDVVKIPRGKIRTMSKLAKLYRIELFLDHIPLNEDEYRRLIFECCKIGVVEKVAHNNFAVKNFDIIFIASKLPLIKKIWRIQNSADEKFLGRVNSISDMKIQNIFDTVSPDDKRFRWLLKKLSASEISACIGEMALNGNRNCLKIPKMCAGLCGHYASDKLKSTELGRELIATVNLHCPYTHQIPIHTDPFGFSTTFNIAVEKYF